MRALLLILFVCVSIAQASQKVVVELGQPLKLETLGGPNLQITILAADSHDVTFTLTDFDRMVVIVRDGNGGSHPTVTTQQVAVVTVPTLLFKRRDVAVFYLGSGSDMNSVSLAVVTK